MYICAEADTSVLYVWNQNKSEIIAEWLIARFMCAAGEGQTVDRGAGDYGAGVWGAGIDAESEADCRPRHTRVRVCGCVCVCMRVSVPTSALPLVSISRFRIWFFLFSFRLTCLCCVVQGGRLLCASMVTVHVMSINLAEIASQPAGQSYTIR